MITQTSSLVVYIIVMLTGRFLAQGQRSIKQSLSSQWRGIVNDPTALFSGLMMSIAIGMAVMEFTLQHNNALPLHTALVGVTILMVGWGVAYFANREIGENWSPTIEKTEKQKLVTSGIYGIVRHPLYLSGLLILVGTNVYFSNRWAWLVTTLMLIVILFRIPIEEKHLKERFSEEYIAYKRRTKAILPWIL